MLIHKAETSLVQTKFKQRIENAVEAFFSDEINEQNSVIIADNKGFSLKHQNSEILRKAESFYLLFKKLFLFFPGVLILHFASISFALFFNSVGVNLSLMLFWIAAGIFMVWAGIGDLKNKKHLLISIPNIILGFIIGTALNYLPIAAFNYSLFLIPLFFIAPILMKEAIDIINENESNLTNLETML